MFFKKNDELVLSELQRKIMAQSSVESTNTLIQDKLNEWHIHNSDAPIKTPLLMIHGYAASSVAFYLTLKKLNKFISDIYLIDLPSNGVSKRSPLVSKDSIHTEVANLKYKLSNDSTQIVIEKTYTLNETQSDLQINNIKHYENYYIDAIDEWRKYHNITKFNLLGHSFGGYMSYKYALKFSQNVEKLLLISPLGVERSIHSIHNKYVKDEVVTVNLEDSSKSNYMKSFQVPNVLFHHQLNTLRWMGPLGSYLAKGFVQRRYGETTSKEYQDLVYHTFYNSKSGFAKENIQSFTNLFSRQVTAKDPLLDNVKNFKVTKVLLMYGDQDWMDKKAGFQLAQELVETGHDVTFKETPNAGHNIFIDNPAGFSTQLIDFLNEN